MGVLITIEANDGSGKETQSKRLLERLMGEGYKVKLVDFPNYQSESSALVKMYLRGDFGSHAEDVNPYAASVFFAVDRFASYKKDWETFYQEGGIIIADRYTTANMVHQSTKFTLDSDRQKFLTWLETFEYETMGIPRPDVTFFLDVPASHSIEIVKNRNSKLDGTTTKDIHERDEDHLTKAYESALRVCEAYGWQKITCMDQGTFRPIETIHNEIYASVKAFLKQKGLA